MMWVVFSTMCSHYDMLPHHKSKAMGPIHHRLETAKLWAEINFSLWALRYFVVVMKNWLTYSMNWLGHRLMFNFMPSLYPVTSYRNTYPLYQNSLVYISIWVTPHWDAVWYFYECCELLCWEGTYWLVIEGIGRSIHEMELLSSLSSWWTCM
jgi:hypothetical protein